MRRAVKRNPRHRSVVFPAERVFSKRTYHFRGRFNAKQEAQRAAAGLRKRGMLARVVPDTTTLGTRIYLVYNTYAAGYG